MHLISTIIVGLEEYRMKLQRIDQLKFKEVIGEPNFLEILQSINAVKDNIDKEFSRYYIIANQNNILAYCALVGEENYLFYGLMDYYELKNVENIIIDLIEAEHINILRPLILRKDIAQQKIFTNRGYELENVNNLYCIYTKLIRENNSSFSKLSCYEDYVLLLTNNANGLELYNRLSSIGEKVILYSKRINKKIIKELKPKFVISYNYSYIITDDVIGIMENRIINMHISLLPWNRGASPNFWSFIDNTPKGVTIHKIDTGLDTGEIILQKQIEFDEKKETFNSSYNILNSEIVELLINNWATIKSENYICKKKGIIGTYHSIKDFKKFTERFPINWNDTIYDYKTKYQL